MGKAFVVTWRSIKSVYEELFPMVGMNALWFFFTLVVIVLSVVVFTIPSRMVSAAGQFPADFTGFFDGVMFGLLCFVLIIGPNPASAGFHIYANRMVKEERYEFADFWQSLRQYGPKSAVLCLISLVGFLLVLVNIAFYLHNDSIVLKLIGLLWFYVFYFWLSMQMYILPLLVEQDQKGLKLIYKNAAILAVDNALFSLALLLIMAVLVVLSVAVSILIVLLGGSLIAMIEHRAVLTLLEKYRARAKESSS